LIVETGDQLPPARSEPIWVTPMSGRDPIEFRVSNNCRGAETSRRCDVTPSRGLAKLKLHAAARRRQAETTGLHGTVARRANIDDEVTVHDRGNALDEQSSDERAYVRTSFAIRAPRCFLRIFPIKIPMSI